MKDVSFFPVLALMSFCLAGCEQLLSDVLEPKKHTAELQRQELECKLGSTNGRCYDLNEGEPAIAKVLVAEEVGATIA